MRAHPPNRGSLLVEMLLALTLGLLVLLSFCAVLVSSMQWIRALWERAEGLEVVRTTWVILDEELRPGRFGRDWTVSESGETIALRAYRGVAWVCDASPSSGSWTVRYRGRRTPDPARDSVLVLGMDGGWRAFALEGANSGGECDPEDGHLGASPQRWSWSQSGSPSPVLARLFERGEYHLSDGALRYRRGAGGRQPLTPERLTDDSRFRAVVGGVEVRLGITEIGGTEGERDFTWVARGEGGPSLGGATP